MSTSSTDRRAATAAPATLVRTILGLLEQHDFTALHALAHPDGEFETGFATPGTRLGRERLSQGLWVAVTSGAYKPEFETVQTLDDRTALLGARFRYEVGDDLHSVRDAAVLMTFKDGLLWRTRIFDSIEAALDAHGAETDGEHQD